ncbi:lactate utilization protein [Candidatus Woesearchaeota archaeon]|nr:lactate utilization protein [Candidatus Woesearchaeota archaeon]
MNKILSNLEKNNFSVFFTQTKQEAVEKALSLIPLNSTIGFGGSMSVEQIGLKEALVKGEKQGKYKLYDQYKPGISREKNLAIRYKGMQADVFITGTNAITEKGELVNIDGFGNRVAAQICGPKKVVIIAGKNKVVKNYEQAIKRIKRIAAPLNAKRLNKKTPCVRTGRCMSCDSVDRICNYTTIIHKSRPEDRISVIIVNQDLGL